MAPFTTLVLDCTKFYLNLIETKHSLLVFARMEQRDCGAGLKGCVAGNRRNDDGDQVKRRVYCAVTRGVRRPGVNRVVINYTRLSPLVDYPGPRPCVDATTSRHPNKDASCPYHAPYLYQASVNNHASVKSGSKHPAHNYCIW